jgi:hypothetical protein
MAFLCLEKALPQRKDVLGSMPARSDAARTISDAANVTV